MRWVVPVISGGQWDGGEERSRGGGTQDEVG